ncbi:hypothetical protein ACH52_1770 [Eubacterium limosum]|nr:hypothetical protein ACH52_1770 [Eubacterium limosum]
MPEKKIVPGEMEDIDVDYISLVKKGANKQEIAIYKEDTELTEEEKEPVEKSFFEHVKAFFMKQDSEKIVQKEEEELNKEELQEVIKSTVEEVVKPLNEKIEAIEKEEQPEEVSNTVKVEMDAKEMAESIKDIVKEAVGGTLEDMEKRLSGIEKSRGIAKSDEAEDPKVIEKEADIFDGYFVAE